ncbi:MAG: tetratricopeptide repeat protein [Anaeromyxobacteraceae bacterium]
MDDDLRDRLARCEELRQQSLRGDAAVGILSLEELRWMERELHALAAAGVREAWTALARYHLDPGGLAFSVADAADCASRAVALESVDGRDELIRVLPAARAELEAPPASAAGAQEATLRMIADDPGGRWGYLAGLLAFHGWGRARDVPESFRLHEAAASRGSPDAMFEVSVLLASGLGVPKDPVASLDWCRRAAEAGHPRAAYNMGAFHATGAGVERDEVEARRWYGLASEAGNARASATLAVMVSQGSGGPADEARAAALLESRRGAGAGRRGAAGGFWGLAGRYPAGPGRVCPRSSRPRCVHLKETHHDDLDAERLLGGAGGGGSRGVRRHGAG